MARGKVELRVDICKACELCVSVCPRNCLAIDQEAVNAKGYHPIKYTVDTCIACGNCAIICPDGVINVYKEGRL